MSAIGHSVNTVSPNAYVTNRTMTWQILSDVAPNLTIKKNQGTKSDSLKNSSSHYNPTDFK